MHNGEYRKKLSDFIWHPDNEFHVKYFYRGSLLVFFM